MKIRLIIDCAAGRAGAVVDPSQIEANRLVRAGAAYPVTFTREVETAMAVPAEELAIVRIVKAGRPKKVRP